ncbi:hypothetical protein ACTHGU_19905 [Chitinophagaceae bacterium MMS25-I14]
MKKLIVLTASGILLSLSSCTKQNDSSASHTNSPSKVINLSNKGKFSLSGIWEWVKGVFKGGGLVDVHVTYKDGSYYDGHVVYQGNTFDGQGCIPTNAICISEVVVSAGMTTNTDGHSFDGVYGYANDGRLALAVCEDMSNPEYVKNYVGQNVFHAATPIQLPAEAKSELGLPDDYVIPAGEYHINYVEGKGFYVEF